MIFLIQGFDAQTQNPEFWNNPENFQPCVHWKVHIFDLHSGAGASTISVSHLQGNWLAARIADLTPDLCTY